MEDKKSYRSIAKSTSIFGGVQVLQIIVNIVRGKIVAVLIGATGMGLNAILGSITNLVVQVFKLGLDLSAVREISLASESGDGVRLSRTVRTFKRWMLWCAVAGAATTVVLSPYISRFSFDSDQYTWWVAALGIVVFFTMYGNANIVLMQGLRRLKDIAKSTLLGLFSGLLMTIPLYYFLGIDGIIPALILSAVAVYLTNWWFARKVELEKVSVAAKESFRDGKDMVRLGVVLMVSALLGTLTTYLINTFVAYYGDISDVGLFSAGTSITNQYVGVIFTAMSVDYFPRLIAVCHDRGQLNRIVNQQAEMVVILVAPLVILMMLTAPLLIRILLSAEFLQITGFVTILAFGMIIKAAAYAVGYISFAKGDKRLFFYFDGLGNLVVLGFVVLGYMLGGLIGMAVAYLCSYTLFYAVLLMVVKVRYSFVLDRKFVVLFLHMLGLAGIVFVQTRYFTTVWGYLVGCGVMLFSLWYAYQLLDERIGVKQLIGRFFKKKNDEPTEDKTETKQ